jgi:hypothetical protein
VEVEACTDDGAGGESGSTAVHDSEDRSQGRRVLGVVPALRRFRHKRLPVPVGPTGSPRKGWADSGAPRSSVETLSYLRDSGSSPQVWNNSTVNALARPSWYRERRCTLDVGGRWP